MCQAEHNTDNNLETNEQKETRHIKAVLTKSRPFLTLIVDITKPNFYQEEKDYADVVRFITKQLSLAPADKPGKKGLRKTR